MFLVLLVRSLPEGLAIGRASAAGAMLSLVAIELVPQACTRARWRSATASTALGGALMLALAAVLGV